MYSDILQFPSYSDSARKKGAAKRPRHTTCPTIKRNEKKFKEHQASKKSLLFSTLGSPCARLRAAVPLFSVA